MTAHTHMKIADPLPGRGGAIQLVHYFPTRDGWASELVEGKYLSATTSTIKIRRGGETVELDRDKWAVCMSDAPVEAPSADPAPALAPAEAVAAVTCSAVRTRFIDDPAVRDIRPVGSHGKQRAGTRKCAQCGAEVTVTQRLVGGVPATAWLYEEHTVRDQEAVRQEEADIAAE
jgi:hypothetical protein